MKKLGWYVSTPTELRRYDTLAPAKSAMLLHTECSLLRECECGCGQPAALPRVSRRVQP